MNLVRFRWILQWIAIGFFLIGSSDAAFRHVFRTSAQDGFAKRNRQLASEQKYDPNYKAQFQLDTSSIRFNDGIVNGILKKHVSEKVDELLFPFTISFLKDGSTRFELDEQRRMDGDVDYDGVKVRKDRFDITKYHDLGSRIHIDTKRPEVKVHDKKLLKVDYGDNQQFSMILHFQPFMIEFLRDGNVEVVLNQRQLLNMEHYRSRSERSQEDEPLGMWEEKFDNILDSKPRGSESLGLDISFIGYKHVYGVPEHTSSLSLKETNNSETGYTDPYRLYNVDIFEYEVDSPMSQYGAIPFMQAHKRNSDVGIFWSNAAATWIDIEKDASSTSTHWYSESGKMDVFIYLGPTALDVYKAYSGLTGRTQLPPLFSLGYHQCRWNYFSEEDVQDVDNTFNEVDMPYDAIWLDVDYTSGRRYFTWNEATFPHPQETLKKLDSNGRKMVVILDPHIKNDPNYFVSKELIENDFAVKDSSGVDNYNAECWPGDSIWVDFFNLEGQKWWGDLYSYDKFKGSDKNLFIWNDMNEPSVFKGPETSMHRDAIHHGGWEHRDIHNFYGHQCINSTYEGMIKRDHGEIRPFILTRSFFAGTNALAASWIGDTLGTWEHFRGSLATVLTNGVAGMPFSGADVAGFFGNPDSELFVRWYELGIFYPFFRAHAHIDTKRREPWLYGEPYTSMIRNLLGIRYRLLPTWYTTFHTTHMTGLPVLRPQFLVHPEDEQGFDIDDQFYLGDSGLLVKPVLEPGVTETGVYIADGETYYYFYNFDEIKGKGKHVVPATLGKIPILLRGGNILVTRERIRRASELTINDPYTLYIAVSGKTGSARGELYMDDGTSFEYKKGAYISREFTFNEGVLDVFDTHPHPQSGVQYAESMKHIKVERIILIGVNHQKIKIRKHGVSGVKSWDVNVNKDGIVQKPGLYLV
ncbi:glucosidase II Gls2 [Schizosaccharomyces octosporus yFS286]|uniref:Glucosidase II subunit alpha n=1 Tax=Schizosaccharomyces octosporus (strain yFS286) TaxID=483514 RepID=S9PUT8_SCHOY|nr:glucosidase II Gls2 [Schizosaccharomyces octosporus yFS286]EPX71283.1 glucosidase II Gls2 [Schizosaccharomyces octosporus yFS286]